METGLSCQGHKSILVSWFVHWISIFYYCTFLHRTSPKHLVGTFQRKEFHSSQRKDSSSPHPQKQPTSHQSPFPQIQISISIDKAHCINKIDSCLPCYINVYNVSLMLFDLWVTSGLLMAWSISISWSKTSRRQVVCQLPHHFASWPHSWHASWLLLPSHAKLRSLQINYPTCWINQCLNSSSRMKIFTQILNSVATKFGHFKDTGYHYCCFYYLL